ncbi:MAG TPA: methionine--tRNA ligase [Candidatus Lokiarchaeia archaeon]|nr:methionine--tRNA ligase [Candidatus Lokiarchaeia archaeon]
MAKSKAKHSKKFYVTTPIYYVNDSPHVGSAYTTIAADIVARYYRLSGYDVFFLTGTDEHGQKLEDAASAAGKAPKEFVDEVVERFKSTWKELNISNDHFVRTTDDSHEEFCKLIYNKMKDNGDIYKGEYEGLYCVGCEKKMNLSELVDGKCPLHLTEPIYLKEENYFFKLSVYQEKLLQYYEDNPDFIAPAFRKKEIINKINEGLEDLSISRTTLKWGIPIPDDPEHVMWVWIDALSNYISALGYPGERYQKFWPADVHIVGKDIMWFHMVIWPAMLMSAGFPLPKKVFAHGFWTVDNQKMSKSLHNVINPLEMKEKYGLDAFRYYLFSRAQFGQDNNFSEKELVDVLNTELADDFGNLVNRVIVLVQKYFQGKVPLPDTISADEEEFKAKFDVLEEIKHGYEDLDFSRALRTLWELLRYMNKTITDAEPWVLFKNKEMDKLETLLFNLLEGLRLVAILLSPVIPDTCARLFDALGLENQTIAIATWRNEQGFSNGAELRAENLILFTKKEFSQEPKQIQEQSTEQTNEKETTMSELPPIKEEISFDDFSKLDLRSAKIISAEAFPDSKKLVKLQINLGVEERTIVAGIAEYYEPDQLVGKNIIIVANLAPKKLHGVMSNGMLLAVDINDEPILLLPDKEVEPGFPIH